MNPMNRSLRLRLLIIILIPLLIISMGAVYWRFEIARKTAENIFDRNLIMMSLAISRDVALSGGDSLSQVTANMFRDATGGDIFYHVYGPDGSFVTGYSSPPVYPIVAQPEYHTPMLFDANHLGQPIRAARLTEQVSIDGISGLSVVTVWQPLEPRQAFAARMTRQAAAVTALLLVSVAILVFFGIRYGLRPLKELEAAIIKRSSTDLSPIEREIPQEAKGIVKRLNNLFAQLNEANKAKDRLVSNAAHQLRNPIAAVHSLATATFYAEDAKDMKARASELIKETRRAARLTEQLLSFERLSGGQATQTHTNMSDFLTEEATHLGSRALVRNIDFELNVSQTPIFAKIDQTLLQEALSNLVDNALSHGGEGLSKIALEEKSTKHHIHICVSNDGTLVDPQHRKRIFERFAQGHESQGSGLGLSIVSEIMHMHQGTVSLHTDGTNTIFKLTLPRA